MGDIYSKEGYFHIESLLNPGLQPWTHEEAESYAERLKALAVLGDIDLIFWLIHPRGFGLIVRKTKNMTHPHAAKLEALKQIGEEKFATRWHEQATDGAKPLGAGHAAKHRYFTDLSHDLANVTKTFKQRISAAYNHTRHCVGCIWRDRAKAFNLPEDEANLSEVAAFILTQAEQQNGSDCCDWPGTVAEARTGDKAARRGLEKIVQTQATTPKQIERLLKLSKVMRFQVATPIKAPNRGRAPAWRPECERG
ncbi:hypothetical protein ACWPKS_02605 [Coraliomargarita sp. W4R72]